MSIFRPEMSEDQEYDDFVARVDEGKECPICHAYHGIEKTEAMGLPLWHCSHCSADWFDWVTRPTMMH